MNTFNYNARSEVLYALFGTNETEYVYDDIGNHSLYPANSLNQYLDSGIEYDLDGNMTRHGDMDFTWDAENRLVSAGNGTTNIVNTYDYKHRRVRKTVGSESHAFVYDVWNLLAERINDTDTRHYFWGLDLSDTLQGAGGVGGLLAVSQGGAMYYPVYDNNGNVTAYLDDSGNIVASYEYNAFGETITQSGGMANEFKFRFSTKYHDGETGLYYYGYRFYSPVLRTWLNRDPIGEGGGLNMYSFAENNSINSYDLLGQQGVLLVSPNYEGRVVKSLTDISSANETSAGQFGFNGVDIKRSVSGKICEIRIRVYLNYNMNKPISLPSGTLTGYKPHYNWDDGGVSLNPERGALLAHERGHAQAFLNQFATIEQVLLPFVGQRFVSLQTVLSAFSNVVDSGTFRQRVALGANEAMDRYFSAGDFTRVDSQGHWKKEGYLLWRKK